MNIWNITEMLVITEFRMCLLLLKVDGAQWMKCYFNVCSSWHIFLQQGKQKVITYWSTRSINWLSVTETNVQITLAKRTVKATERIILNLVLKVGYMIPDIHFSIKFTSVTGNHRNFWCALMASFSSSPNLLESKISTTYADDSSIEPRNTVSSRYDPCSMWL